MNFMKVGLKLENGKMVADEGTFRLELPAQQAEALRSYAGKDAIFGIRPEDLVYLEGGERANAIPTKVEVVEPLGAEIHLWVSTPHNQVVARVAPRHMFHVGEAVNFKPDLSKIHFFDIETEKAIF